MDEISVMHVLDCLECLIKEFKSLSFIETFRFIDVVKEVSVFGIFENKINLIAFFKNIVELNNIRMLKSLMDQYLFPEIFLIPSREFIIDLDLNNINL